MELDVIKTMDFSLLEDIASVFGNDRKVLDIISELEKLGYEFKFYHSMLMEFIKTDQNGKWFTAIQVIGFEYFNFHFRDSKYFKSKDKAEYKIQPYNFNKVDFNTTIPLIREFIEVLKVDHVRIFEEVFGKTEI